MYILLQQSEKGESEKDTSSQKDLDLGFPDDDDESQGDGSKFMHVQLSFDEFYAVAMVIAVSTDIVLLGMPILHYYYKYGKCKKKMGFIFFTILFI